MSDCKKSIQVLLRQKLWKSVDVGLSYCKKKTKGVQFFDTVYILVSMTIRVGTKISMIYMNDIYHDSIIIFSLENMIFSIFSKY